MIKMVNCALTLYQAENLYSFILMHTPIVSLLYCNIL